MSDPPPPPPRRLLWLARATNFPGSPVRLRADVDVPTLLADLRDAIQRWQERSRPALGRDVEHLVQTYVDPADPILRSGSLPQLFAAALFFPLSEKQPLLFNLSGDRVMVMSHENQVARGEWTELFVVTASCLPEPPL